MQNRRKQMSESMIIWTVFESDFTENHVRVKCSFACVFFINLLTVSWRRDPRSARTGAVETQFLNLRIIVEKCTFLYSFSAYFATFGPHFFRSEHV